MGQGNWDRHVEIISALQGTIMLILIWPLADRVGNREYGNEASVYILVKHISVLGLYFDV